jgi:hypothetical protein
LGLASMELIRSGFLNNLFTEKEKYIKCIYKSPTGESREV